MSTLPLCGSYKPSRSLNIVLFPAPVLPESMENVTVPDDEEKSTDSSAELEYNSVTETAEEMETAEEATASDDYDGIPEYEMPSIDKKVR